MTRHEAYFQRAGATSIINSVVSAVSVLALLPPLISRIGLDTYGYWAMLGLFVGVASLLDLGISKAIVYLVTDDSHAPGEVLAAGLLLGAVVSVAVAVALAGIAAAGSALFGPAVATQAGLALWIAGCGGGILVCCVLTTVLRSWLEAKFRLDVVNVGFALLTLCNYAVPLALSMLSRDPRVLMLGNAAVYVLILLAHLCAVALIAPVQPRWPRPRTCEATLRAGFGTYLADLPAVLLAPALQYLFSLQAKSGGAYGIFDLALRISTLCATTLSSLSSPFFAIVSATNRQSQPAVRRSIARHLRMTVALALAGWLAFLVIGRPALALLLNQSPNELYRATLIMLAGSAVFAALEPISRMLMGLGRRNALLGNRLLMLSAALLTALLLTQFRPLDRFALAYATGFMVAALGLVLLNRREAWGRG